MAKSRAEYVKMLRTIPYAHLISCEHTISKGWSTRSTLSEILGKKVKFLNWHSSVHSAIRIEHTPTGTQIHVHYRDLQPLLNGDVKKEEHIFHYNPEDLVS